MKCHSLNPLLRLPVFVALLGACARPAEHPPVLAPDAGQAAAAPPADSTSGPRADTAAAPRAATTTTTRRTTRFYAHRPYGSEAQFSPLTEIVNEGFDMLRVDGTDRRILKLRYGLTARNVFSSVIHAEKSYRIYGWGRALRNEFLPLTVKSSGPGGGAWDPNYEFHLIGSGMIGARLVEWFEQHDVSHPVLLSGLTMAAAHFLNEMTESPGPYSEDPVTDLLFFDPAGFFLWRSDFVQRLFSGRMQFTNWPLQPSFVLPSQTLENVGQQYVLRFPLPRTQRWRGLYSFGLSTLIGVSHDLGDGRSLSFGLGAAVIDNPVIDSTTVTKTVDLKPQGGLFYDREGSLLFSVTGGEGQEALATVNIYPGLLRVAGASPGLWFAVLRRGGVRVGLATSLGLGVGGGPPFRR